MIETIHVPLKRRNLLKIGYFLFGIPACVPLAFYASAAMTYLMDVPRREGSDAYATLFMMPIWWLILVVLCVATFLPLRRFPKALIVAIIIFFGLVLNLIFGIHSVMMM